MPTENTATAEQVWARLSALVADHRDEWRRASVAMTGMPFSRVRVLRRVAAKPLSINEIAQGAIMDAPAASVAVSDLEGAGYVVREADPTDRRRKQVRITEEGQALLARLRAVADPVPDSLLHASKQDLQVLARLLEVGPPD